MRVANETAPRFSATLRLFLPILLGLLLISSGIGRASAQSITSSPASLKFPSTIVGVTGAPLSVTLNNSGTSSQPISIVMSGDFSETDNCSGNITSAGSCIVKVSFSPTQAGAISGAVTVFDNNHNLLDVVSLTATGEALLTAAPATIAFGSVPVGTLSATETFKITNNTASAVTITGITASSDYVVSPGTCLTTAIKSKGNCVVSVQVQPTQATTDGAIIITSSIPNLAPLTVKLTGAGSGTATAPLSFSKSSLTLKSFPGGTSSSQTVTITNTSGAALTMGAISASGEFNESNTCPSSGNSLATAAKCTVTITFSPLSNGTIGGVVSVAYTGSNSPQLINLTGTSLAPLTLSPAKLTYSSQATGTTSTAQAVKITNNTTGTITLNTIVPSGDFAIQPGGTTCSLTSESLAAAKSCTLEVVFSPTLVGTVTGSITVADTWSTNPLLIPLSGTAINGTSVALAPTSAHQGSSQTVIITGTDTNFGSTTTVNFGADITVGALTVSGPTSISVPITIDNVAVTGARNITVTTGAQVVNGSFTVVAGVPAISQISPNTIASTQSETVAVTGAFTNWVNGTTTASFGPGISVGGAAVGAFGPVTVTSPTTFSASLVTSGASTGFRNVQVQTSSQTLTVTNGFDVAGCGTSAPSVVSISPIQNAPNVPLNSDVQIQFGSPMNGNSFILGNSGSATIFFYDAISNTEVPGTITLDTSGTIATIKPSANLAAGREFFVALSYASPVQDSCGNSLASQSFDFYTAFSVDKSGPTLTATSPEGGDTNVPISNLSGTAGTPIALQFNEPLDPITAQTGFSLTSGGNTVTGAFSYSVDDKTVTFTPTAPLSPATEYTVSYSTQITDTAGNALANPGSFAFETGTTGSAGAPTVTIVDPPNQATSVGLNVAPHVEFSEPVDELTIPSAFVLSYENGAPAVPAAVTVAANRLSATITPSAALLPNTEYGLSICGYSDLAGDSGACFNSVFYTGTVAVTSHASVSSISPTNNATGAPLNAQVVAVMSSPIDPTTITSTSISLVQGGTPVGGTVSLASDNVTLTFVPSSNLSAETVYSVSVAGFADFQGNSITPFSSSFTTGTSSYNSNSFKVTSTSPVDRATSISVTSQAVFTFSNLINPASVSAATAQLINVASSSAVAGTYAVSGNTVTFTPLTPYPANAQMQMYVNGVTDAAGNQAFYCCSVFTTTSTPNLTAPTVAISPANGTSNVGLNTPVVITFSKSVNPATITPNSVALFNGDTSLSYSYTISSDNRTIVLTPSGSGWTSGATVTVALSSTIQDLSGNSLANTTSEFSLVTALSSVAPQVLSMRPGNGATNVASTSTITLFTSAAMNSSTVTTALNVTDNGAVVSGTVQTYSNGQAIVFTPAVSFNPGDLIQVFFTSAAQGTNGVPLSNFSGQFTVAGSPTNTAAQVQSSNPFPNAVNVPLNTVIQVAYNQSLIGSTVTCNGASGSVTLYQASTSTYLTPNCTVSGGVITIAPTSNFVSGSQYQVYVNKTSTLTNGDGIAVQTYSFTFTAGTATDTAKPTIVYQAPTNGATNIGTNAQASVTFSKAINPVSVTGSTIQLTGGGTTQSPSSIAFSPDYTRVTLIPQAPLPASTQMTFAVNGVLSQAGIAVATSNSTFTTSSQPDFSAPYVINSSVQNGQLNVPVNAAFSLTFSKPIDVGTSNSANVNISSTGLGAISATISWSSDQKTLSLVPNSVLYVGTQYCLQSSNLADLNGNIEQIFSACFTTSFAPNSNPPAVLNVSPQNSQTQIPSNSPIQILFSEPIQPTSISQITLTTSGNPVPFTSTFTNANQLLTLTPTLPLLTPTFQYILTVTGVKDTAGNQMTGAFTDIFTTGSTFDLTHPSVVLSDPGNAALGIGTNVLPKLQFSKPLNPISVVTSSNEGYNGNGSVELFNNATNQWVPVTVTLSASQTTATITPTTALSPSTQYEFYVGCSVPYYDVAGNAPVSCYNSIFTTAPGAVAAGTSVSSISPANNQTAVPTNAEINVVMTDTIDPTSIANASVTVTPQGGSAITGTLTLESNGLTLNFVPTFPLNVSTSYNVTVGGFNDVQGNPVTSFTSTFTTGTGSYGNGSFSLVSTTPAKGAANISVTAPVTFTMSNLIDPTSVNDNTVLVSVSAYNQVVAGSYSVNGNSVTFTPLTQYPPSSQINMEVCGLLDEAGDSDCESGSFFITASTVDQTSPTVSITPSNGSTNLGLNTQVVLTFSKSLNTQTISSNSVNMLDGDVPLNPSVSISQDGRTVLLTAGTIPAGATITVVATHLITDLSGNPLTDTYSQFTTMAAVSSTAPTVMSMRPANAATNVPTSSVITLFTSAPMSAPTISGSLYVSQNGALISGTMTLGSGGQSIEFSPTTALAAGTLTEVYLTSTAQDVYGNYLQPFVGSFTTAGSLTNTAAVVQTVNPFPNATHVPTNTTIQVAYNQAVKSSSVSCSGNSGSVTLYQQSTSTYLTPNCSVSGGVITISPTSALASGSQYTVYVTGNVVNTDGIAVQPFSYSFTAGSSSDTVAPVINYVAPPASAVNIGTNAGVSLTFNKAINPVSVTGTSVQLSGGGYTAVPASISFTPDYTRVIIIPQAPLPSSTQMTLTVSGITSEAGVVATSKTVKFTTSSGPDLSAPYVANPSVQAGQSVGTNAVFGMQFNKPMDPGSVNPAAAQDVYLYDNTTSSFLPSTISFSTDLTTVFLKPTSSLTPSHSLNLCSSSMTDLSGYPQQNFCVTFGTGTGTQTSGPSVTSLSPPNAFTGAATNAPVQVLFSEPIDAASLGGMTLKQGSTSVPAAISLFDGDKGIQLLPLAPLTQNATYTVNVTGVLDITGNAQTTYPAQSFTTGSGIDLVPPQLNSTTPANFATAVALNSSIQVVFSEPMDPASFDSTNSFTLVNQSGGAIVPATISFSSNYSSVTLQPTSNLSPGVTYFLFMGYYAGLYDIAGNPLVGTYVSFTTQ